MTADPKSWTVRVKATVTREVYCEDCTEEQARKDPYKYSVSEVDLEQTDYEVLEVEPNV